MEGTVALSETAIGWISFEFESPLTTGPSSSTCPSALSPSFMCEGLCEGPTSAAGHEASSLHGSASTTAFLPESFLRFGAEVVNDEGVETFVFSSDHSSNAARVSLNQTGHYYYIVKTILNGFGKLRFIPTCCTCKMPTPCRPKT